MSIDAQNPFDVGRTEPSLEAQIARTNFAFQQSICSFGGERRYRAYSLYEQLEHLGSMMTEAYGVVQMHINCPPGEMDFAKSGLYISAPSVVKLPPGPLNRAFAGEGSRMERTTVDYFYAGVTIGVYNFKIEDDDPATLSGIFFKGIDARDIRPNGRVRGVTLLLAEGSVIHAPLRPHEGIEDLNHE